MGDPYPGKIKYEGGSPVRLTYEEIVASVALGGWPEHLWPTAVAVASYESQGGTINVYNTYKEGHWGLFQISKSAHPSFFSGGSGKWVIPWENAAEAYRIYQRAGNSFKPWEAYTNGRYTGSLLQATAAVQLVKRKRSEATAAGKAASRDFYLSLFRKGLLEGLYVLGGPGAGSASVGDAIGGAATGTGQSVASVGATVAEAAAQSQASGVLGGVQLMVGAARWMGEPGNWLRVAQVVLGGGLLLAGISVMAKPLTAGAVKAAGSVAPVAKGAKKAAAAVRSAG